VREALRKSRWLRRAVRWLRSKSAADPGWDRLLRDAIAAREWREALAAASSGTRVLLGTSLGGHWAGTTLESLLAVALTLRGAQVEVLLCDGVLAACQLCELRGFKDAASFAREGPQASLCRPCLAHGLEVFEGLGLRVHRLGEWLRADEVARAERLATTLPVAEIGTHVLEGASLGEQALAGALRFFARGDLEGEPQGEAVLRRYLQAAIVTFLGARRLLRESQFTCAAFHHGIYVPQGALAEAAREAGVRIVNWNPAYRKRRFIFSHGGSYHHTLLSEPAAAWESMPWGPRQEEELDRYLRSRWRGTEDWIWFHREPTEDLAEAQALGLDLSRPYVGLLTNVIWDAQLHYPRRAFSSMMAWLAGTVRHFASRPELQLAIRVHPAEIRGTLPSRQRVVDELRRELPALPRNVIVVPPESRLSTYALLERADAALIYGTKTGVELAAMGIPVIVAGEAWVRGKGFTHDAASEEEYYQLLGRLPLRARLDPAAAARARRYAYHFFFRRMIPIDCTEPTGGDPPYRIRLERLSELRPGRMPGLDVVLDGILEGSPFVFRAELEGEAAGEATHGASRLAARE
jgi:hypothetical protein